MSFDTPEMKAKCKKIVDARDYEKMVPFNQHPDPGEYVITSLQAGNFHGERGWHLYIGYVVQVRKQAGVYGTDLVILRHPDGTLMQHHNQSFHRMAPHWLEQVKSLYPHGITPAEYEDYSEPYTLGNGQHPETGKVIEPKGDGPIYHTGPMAKITICQSDGTKVVEVV